MFVQERMSSPAVTVGPDMPFQEALRLMQEKDFRRLPIVDKQGKLIGIVAERDLLYASPSPATSLSVWEMNYMLSKIKVERLMSTDVITTSADAPIEEAAHLMVTNRIGGLPVVDEENQPVGMITETDLFKAFVELFSGGYSGLRITMEVPRGKGVLVRLSKTIYELGGDILSIGAYDLEDPTEDKLVMKIREVSKEQLVDTLEALGEHILDAREV